MTRYTQGSQTERHIKQWLERNGYYVMRSAGSHTAFDLAVFPLVNAKEVGLDNCNPFVIQCKSLPLINYTVTQLDQYLWSKELCDFRQIKLQMSLNRKFLFIFESKKLKIIPYVYEFKYINKDWNYIKIDLEEFY